MAKLNHLLLAVVVACALGVVTSQHKARALFAELQQAQAQAQAMDVEWGQLQLEQSTLATPVRVEKIAVQKLHMDSPKGGQVIHARIGQSEGMLARP